MHHLLNNIEYLSINLELIIGDPGLVWKQFPAKDARAAASR